MYAAFFFLSLYSDPVYPQYTITTFVDGVLAEMMLMADGYIIIEYTINRLIHYLYLVSSSDS